MTKETMLLNKISTVQARNLQLYTQNKNLKKEIKRLTNQLEETLDIVKKYKKELRKYVDEAK